MTTTTLRLCSFNAATYGSTQHLWRHRCIGKDNRLAQLDISQPHWLAAPRQRSACGQLRVVLAERGVSTDNASNNDIWGSSCAHHKRSAATRALQLVSIHQVIIPHNQPAVIVIISHHRQHSEAIWNPVVQHFDLVL